MVLCCYEVLSSHCSFISKGLVWYRWNIAKFCVKHQSINQSINLKDPSASLLNTHLEERLVVSKSWDNVYQRSDIIKMFVLSKTGMIIIFFFKVVHVNDILILIWKITHVVLSSKHSLTTHGFKQQTFSYNTWC